MEFFQNIKVAKVFVSSERTHIIWNQGEYIAAIQWHANNCFSDLKSTNKDIIQR